MVMENTITINVCLRIHVYITERFPLCFKVLTLTKKLTKTHKMRSKYFLQTTTIIYYLIYLTLI